MRSLLQVRMKSRVAFCIRGGYSVSIGTLSGTGGTLNISGGSLSIYQQTDGTYAGAVAGSGTLSKLGTGLLVLNGSNTHTGAVSVNAGTLQAGNAGALSQNVAYTVNGGTLDMNDYALTMSSLSSSTGATGIIDMGSAQLTVNQSGNTDYYGTVTGTGAFVKQGNGALALNGVNTYTGNTTVSGGTLIVGSTNTYASAQLNSANVTVQNNATLRGHGTVNGNVLVNSGGHLAPGGSSTDTALFTINGNLTLAQGSVLDFSFKNIGVNDQVYVDGDLTLNGTTLNVADAGGFGPGLYRLFDYSGTLQQSNGGILFGTSPAGYDLDLQYLVGQVNLISTADGTLNFWNAQGTAGSAVVGGSGTWSKDAQVWSDKDGYSKDAMNPYPGFAIFDQTAGTVTLSDADGQVQASGLQFATSGYVLQGTSLELVSGSNAEIRVGDGSAASAGYTATIDSEIKGTEGLQKTGAGTLILTGNNTYTGNTVVNAGTLQGNTDSIRNNVVNQAKLVFDQAAAGTFAGNISGAGEFAKEGAGTLLLTGNNTYTGKTVIDNGTLQAGGSQALVSGRYELNNTGALDLNDYNLTMTSLSGAAGTTIDLGSAQLTVNTSGQSMYSGAITGTGNLIKSGAGNLLLDGVSSYTGGTVVQSGALIVGSTSAMSSARAGSAGAAFTVNNAASLGGFGTVAGNVEIRSGGVLTPGYSGIGQLNIDGSLTLQAGSILNFDFGAAGMNDQVAVSGDVTLNGTSVLNINDNGSFASGIYNLISYTGTKYGTGVIDAAAGTVPSGYTVEVKNSTGLIYLESSYNGGPLNYWNPLASTNANNMGGNGTWSTTSLTWSDAAASVTQAMYPQPGFAIFKDNQGAVTVSGSGVAATGMQFLVNYTLMGDTLTLASNGSGQQSAIRTGDGTASVTPHVAINNVIAGTNGLDKQDAGTLYLTANNTFSGGVSVTGGVLSVGQDSNLGAASNAVALKGGTLEVTGGFASARNVAVTGTTSAIRTAGAGATLTLNGNVTGAGALTKDGAGTLVLNGNNTYSGATTVAAGTLRAGSSTGFTQNAEYVVNGGVLDLNDFALTAAGLSGAGGQIDLGSAALTVDQSTTASFAGDIQGTGSLTKTGAGALTLSGNNTYSGITTVTGGTLQAGSSTGLAQNTAYVVNGGILSLNNYALNVSDLSGTGGHIDLGSALLTVDQSTMTSYAGIIEGTGGLTHAGTGTLTLNGVNTYTGNTTINAGTLIVGDSTHQTARIVGGVHVNSGATLGGFGRVGDTGNDVIVASGGRLSPGAGTGSIGQLTVAGDLNLQSGSIVDLDFAASSSIPSNDYISVAGELTLGGSTLNIHNTGSFGTGVYAIMGYGTLNGSISSITIGSTGGANPSYLSLSNQSNEIYLNNINNGVALNYWNAAGSTGNLVGGDGVWSSGAAVWTDATASVANGNMVPQPGFAVFGGSQAGNVTVSGNIQTLGMQFLTDGYVLNGGAADSLILEKEAGQSYGRIVVGTNSNASAGYSATINTVIAGIDGLQKEGAGKLILTGNNTYTGGTVIAQGVLQGNAQSIRGDVLNYAELVFDQVADATFANNITGTGNLTKEGAGVLTLSGSNTYSGDTLVNHGTLQAGGVNALAQGHYSISSTGTLDLNGYDLTMNSLSGDAGAVVDLGSAELTIDHTKDSTFNGTIVGAGSAVKTGSYTLILDGVGNHTGGTTVNGGALIVGSTAANSAAQHNSDVTVNSGARLGGHGSIGGHVVLNSGAILAPGNSIGELTVNDITFNAGSIYEFEVNPDGSHDHVNALGTATINGGHVQVLAGAGSWAQENTYTILTAASPLAGTGASKDGAFDSVSSNLVFMTPTLTSDTNHVYLNFARNSISFGDVAYTVNQRHTGWAIDLLGAANPVYQQIVSMDAASARASFDNLSGEAYASTRSALLSNSRYLRSALNNRLLATSDNRSHVFNGSSQLGHQYADASGYSGAASDLQGGAVQASSLGGWVDAWGHDGEIDGDGNAAKVDNSGYGFVVGVDTAVGENSRVGIAAGYEHSKMEVNDNRYSTSEADALHLAVYGSTSAGPIDLRGGLSYSYLDIDTDRNVWVGSVSGKNSSSYNAHLFQIFGEGSHTFELTPQFNVTPYLNLAHVYLDTDDAKEGWSYSGLQVEGGSDHVTYTTLGARAQWDVSDKTSLHADLGWQHAFGDTDPQTTNRFMGSWNGFSIQGAPLDRNSAVIGLGVSFRLNDAASLKLGYQGQIGSDASDHGANLRLDVRF
ncbi:autotransporter-associated beta strand repeat-containing protein [Saezia sanguinis]|uniref:autotransporter-associated beta strand repeat-containing protein n=1 Tax=Saezia sanguinis TaxID=1965230 RepID=UPI0030DBFBC4